MSVQRFFQVPTTIYRSTVDMTHPERIKIMAQVASVKGWLSKPRSRRVVSDSGERYEDTFTLMAPVKTDVLVADAIHYDNQFYTVTSVFNARKGTGQISHVEIALVERRGLNG